ERRGILRESSSAPQFPGERPKRIVDVAAHRFWNRLVIAPTPLVVVRMHPIAIVQDGPKCVPVDHAEVGDNLNQHIFDPLLLKCPRQMMMVYNIEAIVRTPNDWDH